MGKFSNTLWKGGWLGPINGLCVSEKEISYCRVIFLRLLMNVVSEESLLNFIVIPLGVFKRRATISSRLGERV
jgi:hypothetical protein